MAKQLPEIASITPVAGPIGTVVNIKGAGFCGNGNCTPTAFLNGMPMIVTDASEESVTAIVPTLPDGTSSPIALQIGDELVWSSQQFSVMG